MKNIKVTLVMSVLTLLGQTSFAYEPVRSYCKAVYGDEAHITYEPSDANGGYYNHSIISSERGPKRPDWVPDPTGFRCQIILESGIKEKKCPARMYLGTKRIRLPICITKVISLTELCYDEISADWPELLNKICKTRAKKIDQRSALKIAENEFVKMYGKTILTQRPFSAILLNGLWKVKGTLHCQKGRVCSGGVAEISISEVDGSVISLYHGK